MAHQFRDRHDQICLDRKEYSLSLDELLGREKVGLC